MPIDNTLMRQAIQTDRDQIKATKQLAASNRELARTIQRGWDALAILLESGINEAKTVGDANALFKAAEALRKPPFKMKGGDDDA